MKLIDRVELLREFGHLINVPNNFRLLQPMEKQKWIDESFFEWFSQVADSPPAGVRRFLLSKATRFKEQTAYRRLQQIAQDMIESQPDGPALDSPNSSPRWQNGASSLLKELEPLAHIAAKLTNETDDFLAINLREIATSYQRIMRRQALGTCDDDVVSAEMESLAAKPSWRWRGRSSTLGGVSRQHLLAQRDELKAHLNAYVLQTRRDTAALLRHELADVVRRYADKKARRGALDDNDVIHKTEALLRVHTELIHELQTRHEASHVETVHPGAATYPKTDPTFVALHMVVSPTRYGRVLPFQIDQALPEVIGAFVDCIIHASNESADRSGGQLPHVDPTQVCLVFPRIYNIDGEDVRAPYMRALEAKGICYTATETWQSFFGREEVRALRTALAAIEWPNDELVVYATLRGPLFGFSDESLLLYRQRAGSLRAQALQLPLALDAEHAASEQLSEIAEVLEALETFHELRNTRMITDTYDAVLEYAHVDTNLAFWRSGSQALRSIEMLSELARIFSETDMPSFRSFVKFLQQEEGLLPVDISGGRSGTSAVLMRTLEEAAYHACSVSILCDPTAQLDDGQALETVMARTRDIVAFPTLQGAIDGWTVPVATKQNGRTIAWTTKAQPNEVAFSHGLRHQHTLEPGSEDGRGIFEAWLAEQNSIRDAASRPQFTIAQAKATPAPSLPVQVQLHTQRYSGDVHPLAKLAWIISQPIFMQAAEARLRKQCSVQVPMLYKDATQTLIEGRCDFIVQHHQDHGSTVLNIRSVVDAPTDLQHENELAHCALGVHKATHEPVQGILLLV